MKNEKKKRAIRYSAFVIAAILAIGSFSVWAMNTQATADATVDIGEAPPGLNVERANDNGVGNIIEGGILGRPDSLQTPELFTVEQPSDNPYEGAYEVTLYVTNVDELVDDFRYLNIEIEADGVHAGYITLENGRVTFAVEHSYIEGDSMEVNVAGGSYQAFTENTVDSVDFLIEVSEGSTQETLEFNNT